MLQFLLVTVDSGDYACFREERDVSLRYCVTGMSTNWFIILKNITSFSDDLRFCRVFQDNLSSITVTLEYRE